MATNSALMTGLKNGPKNDDKESIAIAIAVFAYGISDYNNTRITATLIQTRDSEDGVFTSSVRTCRRVTSRHSAPSLKYFGSGVLGR